MQAASLMPGCGCVTLRNATDAAKKRDIFLVSEMFGTRRGALRLDAGQQARIRFDWAGQDDADRYEIFAHEVGPDGNPGARLAHAWDGFTKVGSMSRPRARTASASLDRSPWIARTAPVEGQAEVRHEPGVHVVDGGRQIELASVQPPAVAWSWRTSRTRPSG